MKTWAYFKKNDVSLGDVFGGYIYGHSHFNFWANIEIDNEYVSKAQEIRSDNHIDSFICSLNETGHEDCSYFIKAKISCSRDDHFVLCELDYPIYLGSDFERAKELVSIFEKVYCVLDNFNFPKDKVKNYSCATFVDSYSFDVKSEIRNLYTEHGTIFLLKESKRRIKNIEQKEIANNELQKYYYGFADLYAQIGSFMVNKILCKAGIKISFYPSFKQVVELKKIVKKYNKNWNKDPKFQVMVNQYLKYCEDLKDISKIKKTNRYDKVLAQQKLLNEKEIKFIKSLKIKTKSNTGKTVKV